MKRLNSLDAFDWIEDGRGDPFNPGPEGQMIEDFIAPDFPSYAKIYHPIYAKPEPNDVKTWDEARRESGADDSELEEILDDATTVYGTAGETSNKIRVRYEDLADQIGAVFHEAFHIHWLTRRFPDGSWPTRLYGPSEGDLDGPILQHLVETLQGVSSTSRHFFWSWKYATIWDESDLSDLLFAGDLSEVLEYDRLEAIHLPPTYWWPDDRSWCLCNDYDLPMTFFGGPEKAVQAILDDEVTEGFRVTPTTRTDVRGDVLNRIDDEQD